MVKKIDESYKLIKQAEIFAKSGNWGEEAKQVNSSIIKLDPKNADAYTRLARCHILLGNLASAEQVYQDVLIIYPDNLVAKNNLSRLKKSLPLFNGDKLLQ